MVDEVLSGRRISSTRQCQKTIMSCQCHVHQQDTQLKSWLAEWVSGQGKHMSTTNKQNKYQVIDLESFLHTGHFPTLGLRSRLGTSLRSRLLQDHLHIENTKRFKTQKYRNANTNTSKPWLLLSCSGIVDRLNSTEEKLEAASNNSMVAFLPTDGLTFLSRSAPA